MNININNYSSDEFRNWIQEGWYSRCLSFFFNQASKVASFAKPFFIGLSDFFAKLYKKVRPCLETKINMTMISVQSLFSFSQSTTNHHTPVVNNIFNHIDCSIKVEIHQYENDVTTPRTYVDAKQYNPSGLASEILSLMHLTQRMQYDRSSWNTNSSYSASCLPIPCY
jgi:hypothetical protein